MNSTIWCVAARSTTSRSMALHLIAAVLSVTAFWSMMFGIFFFQAEDGIRDDLVTGVQTCALPICRVEGRHLAPHLLDATLHQARARPTLRGRGGGRGARHAAGDREPELCRLVARPCHPVEVLHQIGRASCRERG